MRDPGIIVAEVELALEILGFEEKAIDEIAIGGGTGQPAGAITDHALLLNVTSDQHHVKYTDAAAQIVADAQIAIHTAISSAHHAKTVSGDIDHGSVSGLGDDDHTQYLLINGSRAMSGNLSLADDLTLWFDTAETIGFKYSTVHGDLHFTGDQISIPGAFKIFANTAADATGIYTPFMEWNAGGEFIIQADGGVSDRIKLQATDGVAISSRTGGNQAYYKDTNVSGSNKTFEVPNVSGEFLVNNGILVIDYGNANVQMPIDGSELQFGAAQDYTIQWDGNDAVHTITAGDFVFLGGDMGIGIATPKSTLGGLDISSGGISLVLGADNFASTRTDNTNKQSRMGCAHHINAEEPFAIFLATAGATNNSLDIGGGTTALNAAVQIRFWTASNTTTVQGTEKMRLTNTGLGINVTDPDEKLEVNGNIRVTEDNQKMYFGALKDASIYYDGTDLVLEPDEIGSGKVKINDAWTLPNVDGGANDILKTDGAGAASFVTPTAHTQISFSMYDAEPARGSETSLDGAFIKIADAQPLNSVPTNLVVSKGTGKLVIVINAGSDIAGEITVTGTSVDRDTGATTADDTDTITVDALTTDNSDADTNGNTRHAFTGAYITSKWFTGTVTLSTANLTLTDVDVYHISFEQFDDTANITLDTFDANILTTNVNAEFDAYLYSIMVTDDKCNIAREASLNVGAGGETALANRYWRLRRGGIAKALDGTTDGTWVDVHYANSPAYVEDVSIKVWATEIVPLTLT